MAARYGSEPEMDSDGLYANPIHGLSTALEDIMKSDAYITDSDREIRQLERDYPDLLLDTITSPAPPLASPVPPLFRIPSPTFYQETDGIVNFRTTLSHKATLPRNSPLPPPKVALPRAQTEPLPLPKSDKTLIPLRSQTAPPELSKNTLTARRCTTNDASPSSFVKFMDVPVTMTREHIHDCLKNNRKWSTVDISNVEIFAIKNKDSTIVNVLKVKFKDDAQSSTAKKVLTTSISFGETISRRCRPWYLSTRSN
ncbi:hypothetical protein M378DRAFT_12498 [Amanita muscaria Koide BX008]|uniref:Uncharacterized protein n=1 Tax=Amanita muscaria (strain Koide BX008) TaxID=946122 RepID=A0A0C2T8R8_AMAMK|nr:hypothetical protein M378DRAFT_12498 [Amanita muscaria Koide BX008]